MEHVEVVGISPTSDVTQNKAKLFEVSPNAEEEQIVEITIDEIPEGQKPAVLYPSNDLEQGTTIVSDTPMAVVVDIGEIHNISRFLLNCDTICIDVVKYYYTY